MRSGVDREARRVVDAVADHRPAVVASRLNAIQLVSALRSVLVGPQLAGGGVHEHSLHVAMSVAPDLRLRSWAIHERVVRGYASVVMQADDLALVIGEILRGMRLQLSFRRHLAIAGGDEH